MNTTAAALQANVTVPTIRTWCRIGAVAAIKQAGRWLIDSTSLAHRIAIGQRKARMTESRYRVEEAQVVKYGKQATVHRIVRTDGTPAGYGPGKDNRLHDAEFHSREMAEFHAAFLENTPAGYRIERTIPRAGSMNRTPCWLLTGSAANDPSTVRQTLPVDWTAQGKNWPENTTLVDVLIHWANQHAAGAQERIQKKAEQDAIEAAEAAVREAREEQLAAVRRVKGTLATPRQVEYIEQLVAIRQRSGEGGGFFLGPTDRAGIEELSKAEASLYIDSLKGNY